MCSLRLSSAFRRSVAASFHLCQTRFRHSCRASVAAGTLQAVGALEIPEARTLGQHARNNGGRARPSGGGEAFDAGCGKASGEFGRRAQHGVVEVYPATVRFSLTRRLSCRGPSGAWCGIACFLFGSLVAVRVLHLPRWTQGQFHAQGRDAMSIHAARVEEMVRAHPPGRVPVVRRAQSQQAFATGTHRVREVTWRDWSGDPEGRLRGRSPDRRGRRLSIGSRRRFGARLDLLRGRRGSRVGETGQALGAAAAVYCVSAQACGF